MFNKRFFSDLYNYYFPSLSLSLSPSDYVITSQLRIDFQSNGTMDVLVGLLDDVAIETEESFTIVLSDPQPTGVVLGISVFNITIVDNDLRESRSYIHFPSKLNLFCMKQPCFTKIRFYVICLTRVLE